MSNDDAYELRELRENLTKVYGIIGETVRKALEGLELTPVAETEPDAFRHTDDHGGSVGVAACSLDLFALELDTSTTSEIYLDQDAVNRLAQYLDRHRTDLTDVREPDSDAPVKWPGTVTKVRGDCPACGHAPHGSVGCGEGGRGLHRCLCRGGSDGA